MDIKEKMGFKDNKIIIFKGNTFQYLDWFRASSAKYNPCWGWAFSSLADIPADMPIDLEPITITWEQISVNDTTMKSTEEIKKVIDTIIYPEDELIGEFVGSIGDRIQQYLTVKRIVYLQTGNRMFIMEDDLDNTYVWFTATFPPLEENGTYCIRGTLKEKKIYKGVRQNILTRCKIM